MRTILQALTFVIFLLSMGQAQSKRGIHFSIEDGLVSNLTKCVMQDSTGYLWIGSDGGLMRYDGHRFEVFRQGFPSFYVKDIKAISDSKLIVLTDIDAGIFEITGFQYKYTSVLKLFRHEPGLAFNYPKSVYITSDGTIWISDLNSIYSLRDGYLKKYPFAEKFTADSYFHSFTIFEDNWHTIYAFSFTGGLFMFDKTGNRFIEIPFTIPSPGFSVETVFPRGNNVILLGSATGVYKIVFEKPGKPAYPLKLYDIQDVSSIAVEPSGKMYVGTYTNGLYETGDGPDNRLVKNTSLGLASIKDLLADRENNLWAASDEGIGVLDENSLISLTLPDQGTGPGNLFVFGINITAGGHVYFTNDNGIFAVHKDSGQSVYRVRVISDWGKRAVYYSVIGRKYIWISYRDQSLECRDINSKKLLFRFYEPNNRYNQLYVDNDENLWAYSDRKRHIARISPDFKMTVFPVAGDVSSISIIKQLRDGKIYAAGIGREAYLFCFNPSENEFVNLSYKGNTEFNPPFSVSDLDQDARGVLHLATSLGYYKGYPGSLMKVELPGGSKDDIMKAVVLDGEKIYLGSDKGVIVYANNEVILFDRQEGLPNSSIINRGLLIDNMGCLWVATASGVAYSRSSLSSPALSPAPVISMINVRGRKNSSINDILQGSSLEFHFSSLCFPFSKTIYKYRLIGLDTTWISTPTNSVFFPKLPVGEYTLQLRAQCVGYRESLVTSYTFSVNPPWYLSTWFIIVYIAAGVFCLLSLINGIYLLRIKKMRQREEELNQLVRARTADLEIAKEKTENLLRDSEKAKKALEESNDLKSQILSIAAHDLKNPLNVIMAYAAEILDMSPNDEITFLSKTLKDISVKMLSIINDLLESIAAKSKTAALNKVNIDPSVIVQNALPVNAKRAYQKKQILSTDIKTGYLINVDAELVTHAVDNILSNAVKYSPQGSAIRLYTEAADGCYRIKVKDEGPGFTENDKKLMFGVFQRLSAKPTANEASSGLGLSIVKDVVEKNSGRVWVESEHKKGATFIIEFPLIQTAAPE